LDVVQALDLEGWPGIAGSPRAAALAAEVDEACRTVGFVQFVNHGLDPDVVGAAFEALDGFFALPLEEKLRWVPPDPAVNRGYAPEGTEALAYSLGRPSPPDLFEAFNLGPDDADDADPAVVAERHRFFAPNLWPDRPAGFRAALTEYFAQVRALAHRVTALFAVALGLPVEFFEAATSHSTDTLRLNHYASRDGAPPPLPGQQRMGAHTDYGIVTILVADPVPGLEILAPDGSWQPVIPRPDGVLVNLGDLTARWTNDRWRSTVHRVVPAGPGVRRRSLAFFHDGNHDAVVSCLPTCHDAAHPPKYPPVLAGQHLLDKLIGPRTLTPSTAVSTVGERVV
jgi:isopenicillin N synthase-like dioxygenase